MGGRGSKSATGAKTSGTAAVYSAWDVDPLTENEISGFISSWKSSSNSVRHAINGRVFSPIALEAAQGFDNWLNSGSYDKTLYRGKRVTKEQLTELQSSVGKLINQDGPASFSKSLSVAKNFATGGYNHESGATQRVIFQLDGGTKAGRDVASVHGFASEKEVTIGSASHMLVSSVETQVINGRHYTIVRGTEVKQTYVSPHKSK